ncbi:hypothetical protein THRCLA_00028 [Thraustotheca clavata]|uniref:Uncharacterized protein n=1 Tax=Thraustotheca clavata TaxID=74557 RepID=A0A1W0ACW7_9STRA|nr:hypothetical protein THRCLA_00028 [Thraustotheca clavata]
MQRGTKKRRVVAKEALPVLKLKEPSVSGEYVLLWILNEFKKWRLFDTQTIYALLSTTKRLRMCMPIREIVSEFVVPRMLESRIAALRKAHFDKLFFRPHDQGLEWWAGKEFERGKAEIMATPIEENEVLSYCLLSTPNWTRAFENLHCRFKLTFLGDRHQLLVSYLCTFEMLTAHLRRHLFFDRSPKLYVNGTLPPTDAIVSQVLRAQHDITISIMCPDFGHPHMFDLQLSNGPTTFCPGDDPVIERHHPIAYPPINSSELTSSVDTWFPFLSKFVSNGGQVSIGRQAHHHMMLLSGDQIVHRHFKHMGSLQRYFESADQHCRRYLESSEDEYDPYAEEDDDETSSGNGRTTEGTTQQTYHDGMSMDSPPIEDDGEKMIAGACSFNADVVFPHLGKFIAAKGWQSIELNVFGSRYATVHKGVQSNSIQAIAITYPPSSTLQHMLTELNACVAPAPLKARTDAIKKRKQEQEAIPANLKYRRFLISMKHAQILQQGQVFSISARQNWYANALMGENIFAQSSPASFVVQLELTFPLAHKYDNSQVISIGLVEPSEYPKTRVSARFVDTNLDFPVLCWRNGLEFLVGRDSVYPTSQDGQRDFMLRFQQCPIQSGDTISLLFHRQDGTVQFAHNQQLQPFYFAGVKCQNFYETGLMVFVTLEQPNVQVRSLDTPNMKFLPPTGRRTCFNFDDATI